MYTPSRLKDSKWKSESSSYTDFIQGTGHTITYTDLFFSKSINQSHFKKLSLINAQTVSRQEMGGLCEALIHEPLALCSPSALAHWDKHMG